MAATRDLDPDQDPKAIYALAGADPDECAPTKSPLRVLDDITGADPDECAPTNSPLNVLADITRADPDECAPTNSPSNIDADGAVFGFVSGVIINLCASILTS